MVGKTDQTFSFEIVTCLLAAMAESGTTIGAKHYAMMEQIDGSKSKSGYEHMFRAVKAKAKEIGEKIAGGEIETAATPGKGKGGKKSATLASGTKKRGGKAASELVKGDEESPSKTVKVEESDDDLS